MSLIMGKWDRDFTYIDDVVEVLCKCCHKPATVDEKFNPKIPNSSSSFAPYRLFNVGCNQPVNLINFIKLLEKNIGKKANIKFKPLQDGDVIETSANVDLLKDWIGYTPNTEIKVGLKYFIEWYKIFITTSNKLFPFTNRPNIHTKFICFSSIC